jgi:hypothetical protein
VSSYNVYRGTIPADGFGSRLPSPPVYDQSCFERDDAHGDGLIISIDGAAPPAATGFYYLVVGAPVALRGGSARRRVQRRADPNVHPCPP